MSRRFPQRNVRRRAANVQVGPFVHNAGASAVMQAGLHEALSRDVGKHDFRSLQIIKEGSGLIESEIGASTPHRHNTQQISTREQHQMSYHCGRTPTPSHRFALHHSAAPPPATKNVYPCHNVRFQRCPSCNTLWFHRRANPRPQTKRCIRCSATQGGDPAALH